MKIRFLIDEHLSPRVQDALLRHDPTIDIRRIGDGDAPPFQTQDPDILRFTEADRRAFVCRDYSTIPDFAAVHLHTGGHHWGILLVRPGTGIGQLADALYLIWECSEAEEWIDLQRWIPL